VTAEEKAAPIIPLRLCAFAQCLMSNVREAQSAARLRLRELSTEKLAAGAPLAGGIDSDQRQPDMIGIGIFEPRGGPDRTATWRCYGLEPEPRQFKPGLFVSSATGGTHGQSSATGDDRVR
jgi:hypothetical protein